MMSIRRWIALYLLGLISSCLLIATFAQKAVRTTPIAVGTQQDIEVVHVGFNYQYDPSFGQFRCIGIQINAVEGEVKAGEWISHQHHAFAFTANEMNAAAFTTAASVKDRALRILLKKLDLESAAPIVTPSTVTSTTTTTSSTLIP